VAVYSSRKEFVDSRPSTPKFPILETNDAFFTCREIVWRWTGSYRDRSLLPVTGITTFDVVFDFDRKLANLRPRGWPSYIRPLTSPTVPSPTSTAVSTTITPSATDKDDAAFPPEHPCHRSGDHVCGRAVPAPEDLSTIRPRTTTTTTSSAANATQTLDKAALELLAALADDSTLAPQNEGPGCAPGNSPDGDPNAGDCEKLKRSPSDPPTADRDRDVEIDNVATATNKTDTPDNYVESDIDFGRVSIKRRDPAPTTRPPPTADRDRDVEIDNEKRSKKHKTKTKTRSTTTTPAPAPTPANYVDSDIDFGRVSIKKRDPAPTSRPPPTADRNRDVEIDNIKRDLTDPPNAHGFDDDEPANRNPDAVDERDTSGLGNEEDSGAGLDEGAGNPSGWRIRRMYVEFDSGAWVRNLGGECGGDGA
jgi:hypothetical protein